MVIYFIYLHIYTYIYIIYSIYVFVHTIAHVFCRGWRSEDSVKKSPTMWVLTVDLRWSGLVARHLPL